MSHPESAKRRAGRFSEAGLMLVILVLGTLLAWLGGSVKVPKFQTLPDGTRERVFQVDPAGEKIPVFEDRNKFLNAQNLAQLAKDTSFIAIMAVGMTLVIIAGQIDLSVGSTYALAGVLSGLILQRYGPEGGLAASASTGAWWGLATCLGTGLICGGLNGAMVVALRVHPFIITLGTMAVFRGIAFVITKGQSIGGFPQEFRGWVKDPVFSASWMPGLAAWESSRDLVLRPMMVMLLVTGLGGLFLKRLASGRRVYAVGGNEVASRFSGVRVGRVKMGVFLLCGLTAGVAAMLSLGYYGSATSGDGQGYELNVIAAAVVGGASLNGGRGSALGALLGALIIQMISSGIVILGIDQSYSQIIVGSVVVIAVLLDQVNTWWAAKRMSTG